MKFQKGNKFGGSRIDEDKHSFIAAVRRAITQRQADILRDCAEALLDKAAAGEAWAIKELADRLDGKAPQSVTVKQSVDVESLTLDELRSEIVRLLGSARPETGSPAQSGGVH